MSSVAVRPPSGPRESEANAATRLRVAGYTVVVQETRPHRSGPKWRRRVVYRSLVAKTDDGIIRGMVRSLDGRCDEAEVTRLVNRLA